VFIYIHNGIHVIFFVAQARVQFQDTSSVPNGSTSSIQDNASPNTRLMRMVQQVKEVLPQVPSPSIARDLSKSVVSNLSQSCPVLIKGSRGAKRIKPIKSFSFLFRSFSKFLKLSDYLAGNRHIFSSLS